MTRAIILAAGQGTRLRPLTNDKPKCLLSLQGKTLLSHQINVLTFLGIKDILVVGGYRANLIKKAGYNCIVNPLYESTNMVETLFKGTQFIRSGGDLIISYGDIVYQSTNLSKVLACEDEIGLMVDFNWKRYWELRFNDPLSDAETLVMDSEGYILELGKKTCRYENVQGQYTGLIKVREDRVNDFIDFYKLLDRKKTYDGKDFFQMYMTSFLQELIQGGWKIKAVPVENGWLEVDSVKDLQVYEKLFKEGKLKPFFQLEDEL